MEILNLPMGKLLLVVDKHCKLKRIVVIPFPQSFRFIVISFKKGPEFLIDIRENVSGNFYFR